MLINYGCEITISVTNSTPVMCLLDVHLERRVDIRRENSFQTSPPVPSTMHIDGFGNCCRRFIVPPGILTLQTDGTIADPGRPDPVVPQAREIPAEMLPNEVLVFLLGSRYCETDKVSQTAWNLFGSLSPGWPRVQAVCNFVHRHLSFGYQYARATRTAAEAYEERVGVCRDFSHLMIAFCRCLNIPARYVNGYLGDIGVPPDPAPMDFSAWVEVFLENRWYTFDARHNVPRIGRIVVARGRDATDVALINSFGPHILNAFKVHTNEVAMTTMAAS